MIKRTILGLNSSVVQSASLYNKNLTVTINGNDYIYIGVPRRVFRGLDKSASPGRFYNQNIKGKYACVGPL